MFEKNTNRGTDFFQFFDEADAGNFQKRVAKGISDTSLGVVSTGDKRKKGRVVVTLDFSQVGESNQVQIDHTVEFKQPTQRGSVSEVHTTSTLMYVNSFGRLSVLPKTSDLFAQNESMRSEKIVSINN